MNGVMWWLWLLVQAKAMLKADDVWAAAVVDILRYAFIK